MLKGASIFIGNHYLLSERQRLALIRAVSSKQDIEMRKNKEVTNNLEKTVINIDGILQTLDNVITNKFEI
ncbi:hypothetical protein CTM_00800 [Clostridium tetanomorphum DSM 665]|uniref:DUF434 domain-containing protein n=1 Tax=Clostridium tetanomorphum TaxID=1553 RepID=A0A923EA88_CLOTT|nr:DUF434 domain-containing protein [Clostridium tetanomorphum]KAJ48683.1 hypothetical protein CTM_27045 [Clostridium tetanomorphum DSM 665]KAJ53763.1 hypothetical protein CTM_00800 [Clostridium tetanomorphum DSM 665]MBC2397274.1 DUF434 domain-containing protein [Clostridium tetanomorphum]SQC02606.1 Protein of uncharacterised function (DUF434) [Clostridium tetanomorphum]